MGKGRRKKDDERRKKERASLVYILLVHTIQQHNAHTPDPLSDLIVGHVWSQQVPVPMLVKAERGEDGLAGKRAACAEVPQHVGLSDDRH